MKFAWSVVLCLWLASCASETSKQPQVAARFHAEELEENHQADLKKRPVFPFSVVPGGTANAAEVKQKVKADKVVREHYQGIQLDKLRPFRLMEPGKAFVSYRVGTQVFWTGKPVGLKAGEVLLSDGKNLLRGRCGNRVSATPMEPVLRGGEPAQALMDAPSYEIPAAGLPDGVAELFRMNPNAPQPLATMSGATLPEEALAVAPSPTAGMIGGGYPGGLPQTPSEGGIVLERYWWWPFYVRQEPSLPVGGYNPPLVVGPGLPLEPFQPVTMVSFPVGSGVVVEGPVGPGRFPAPPFETFVPNYPTSTGTPPIVVAGVTPPGESNGPGDPGNPGNPGDPGTPGNPPTNGGGGGGGGGKEEPPGFTMVPEPESWGLVGLAALLLVATKGFRGRP